MSREAQQLLYQHTHGGARTACTQADTLVLQGRGSQEGEPGTIGAQERRCLGDDMDACSGVLLTAG